MISMRHSAADLPSTLMAWKRRLWQSRFLRAISGLIAASALGQLVLMAAMPFVTRLYSPDDFGVFAVFSAIFGISLVASSLRYELAVPLPASDGNARVLLVLALMLNLATAAIVAVLVLLWGEELALALEVPHLAPVLWMLSPMLIGAGSYRAFRFWAVRRHDFKAIARTRITQSATNAGFQVACGLSGFGAAGLIIGQFFGFSAGTLRLARGSLPQGRTLLGGRFRRRMRLLAARYIRFPKFDVVAAIVNSASIELPNLLLAALFSPAVAGLYLLADKALGAPASLLSQSIGQVLYARSRDAVRQGSIARLTLSVLLGLAAAAALPTLLLFLKGEAIFVLVFGEAWREAGRYAGWLILGVTAQLLFSSVSLVLTATEGQKINLMIQFGLLVLKAAALSGGFLLGDAHAAIALFALVSAAGYLVASAVVIMHARRHERAGAPFRVVDCVSGKREAGLS